MKNITIRRVGHITPSQVEAAAREALTRASLDYLGHLPRGLHNVQVGVYRVSLLTWPDGRMWATIYTTGPHAAAIAEIEEIDLQADRPTV